MYLVNVYYSYRAASFQLQKHREAKDCHPPWDDFLDIINEWILKGRPTNIAVEPWLKLMIRGKTDFISFPESNTPELALANTNWITRFGGGCTMVQTLASCVIGDCGAQNLLSMTCRDGQRYYKKYFSLMLIVKNHDIYYQKHKLNKRREDIILFKASPLAAIHNYCGIITTYTRILFASSKTPMFDLVRNRFQKYPVYVYTTSVDSWLPFLFHLPKNLMWVVVKIDKGDEKSKKTPIANYVITSPMESVFSFNDVVLQVGPGHNTYSLRSEILKKEKEITTIVPYY